MTKLFVNQSQKKKIIIICNERSFHPLLPGVKYAKPYWL